MDRDDPRWASQASYNTRFLKLYDVTTLGVANRLVWSCPTKVMLDSYARFQGARHLDVGPASGYYLQNSAVRSSRLALLDINANVLQYCVRRLAHLQPELIEADVTREQEISDVTGFDSVGLNFVLHCVPLAAEEKFKVVFSNLSRVLDPGGILFGSTIPGNGSAPLASRLQRLYNAKGIFNNTLDRHHHIEEAMNELDLEILELERCGDVIVFAARTTSTRSS